MHPVSSTEYFQTIFRNPSVDNTASVGRNNQRDPLFDLNFSRSNPTFSKMSPVIPWACHWKRPFRIVTQGKWLCFRWGIFFLFFYYLQQHAEIIRQVISEEELELTLCWPAVILISAEGTLMSQQTLCNFHRIVSTGAKLLCRVLHSNFNSLRLLVWFLANQSDWLREWENERNGN